MLLALWKVIDTWYGFRGWQLPSTWRRRRSWCALPSWLPQPSPPPLMGWVQLTTQGTLYWFVLKTFQNFYFYLLSLMFVGFVFCHFGRFSQHAGHSDKYQASQNNWWKVTLPLQSCCWFGSSLTMKCSYGEIGRWELIDNYLVLKGMFFLHSYTIHCFFLLRVSFPVASWVAQLMDGSAGPGIKGGRSVVLGEEGEWDLPISSGQLQGWLFCCGEPYW